MTDPAFRDWVETILRHVNGASHAWVATDARGRRTLILDASTPQGSPPDYQFLRERDAVALDRFKETLCTR